MIWNENEFPYEIGFHMAPKLSSIFPESCLLIVVGIVIGLLLFHTNSAGVSPLTPTTFFFTCCLPSFLTPVILCPIDSFSTTFALFSFSLLLGQFGVQFPKVIIRANYHKSPAYCIIVRSLSLNFVCLLEDWLSGPVVWLAFTASTYLFWTPSYFLLSSRLSTRSLYLPSSRKSTSMKFFTLSCLASLFLMTPSLS